MMSSLALFILALVTAPAKSHYLPCTYISNIVQPITKTDVQKTFSNLNKSIPLNSYWLSNEAVDEINSIIRSLLKGNNVTFEQMSTETAPLDTTNASNMTSIENKAYSFLANKTPRLEELAVTMIPSPYVAFATAATKTCVKAFASAYYTQQAQKALEYKQESELQGYPLFSVAHDIACDKAIELIFTIHCEKARSCDRMAALFIINHTSLFGKKGRIFKEYVTRLNRYYFLPTGMLRCYDPTLSSQRNKRIKSLIRFLTMICSTQEHYLTHLKKGISMGVPELIDRFFADKARNWKPRSRIVRRYTTSILQALLGSQISLWRKVDSSIIREHIFTKTLMPLIDLCTFSAKMNRNSMSQYARSLINKYSESMPLHASTLNLYYNEATPPA